MYRRAAESLRTEQTTQREFARLIEAAARLETVEARAIEAKKILEMHAGAASPEQSLWVRVVTLAVEDLGRPIGTGSAASAKNLRERTQAQEWMRSTDFVVVCRMAGLIPDHVMRVLRMLNIDSGPAPDQYRPPVMRRMPSVFRGAYSN